MRSAVVQAALAVVLVAAGPCSVVGEASDHCDVGILDDPLNFETLYKNKGQARPQPLPAKTHPMCNYYNSQEYAGEGNPVGTCCTGDFVDKVIYKLLRSVIDDGKLSQECTTALERAACFACARDQADFLFFEFNEADLSDSLAEISMCRSTCHTIYEHCKGDAYFYLDGKEMISETRLCNFIDVGVTEALVQTGARVNVTIVDDDSPRPKCFLYDDIPPDSSSQEPKPLSAVNPGTNAYQIVFGERMRLRKSSELGPEEVVVKIMKADAAADAEPVVVILGKDADTALQLVDDGPNKDRTLQINFRPPKEGSDCVLDSSGTKVRYDVIVSSGVIEDAHGNPFPGFSKGDWQISTDGETKCIPSGSRSSADESTDGGADDGAFPIIVAVACVAGVAALVAVLWFIVQRRRSAMAYENQIDFGDEMTIVQNDDGKRRVSEGTTVVSVTGDKFAVRLVPEWEGAGGAMENGASTTSSADVTPVIDAGAAEI